MDLSPYHSAIVFAHVIGVFIFLLGHGISAGVMWRLRTERDPVAVRTLLEFSRWSLWIALVGFAIWFLVGILAGFSGNYWTTGKYWIWVSLVIAVVVMGLMTPLGRIYLNRVRSAVGVDPKTGALDPTATFDPAVLDAAIESGRPVLLAATGLGTVLVLSWLMWFKPF